MAYTNYPNGLTSFGIPLVGSGMIPTSPGKILFVNYTTGSDANRGTDMSKPLKKAATA